MIGPVFQSLSQKYTNLIFLKVDVDAVAVCPSILLALSCSTSRYFASQS